MGELLFSGLTPNLPLMDRPPNSQLLWAHSGAARCKGSPLSFSFGKEMDQPTVCQVHCQGLLHNQTASITLMDTTGVHAVLYKLLHQSHKMVENVTAAGGKKWSACSLLRYRKVSCRKNTTVWSVKIKSPKTNDIFMVICPFRLSSSRYLRFTLLWDFMGGFCPVFWSE